MTSKRTCALCGTTMRGGGGLLPQGQAMCRPCRREHPDLAPAPRRTDLPSHCLGCGGEKERINHWYCAPCRKRKRNQSSRRSPKLATAEQMGYGYEHQKLRQDLVAAHRPGAPCARCGQPMTDAPELLDLDHTDDRTGYLGLSHRTCNRVGTRTRIGTIDRVCAGCGVSFKAKSRSQHYCSRPCWDAHRPRRTGPRKRRTPSSPRLKPAPTTCAVYFPTCERCAVTFTARTKLKRYCSRACREYLRRTCETCGTTATGVHWSRWCSDECHRASDTYKAAQGGRRRRYRSTEHGRAQRRAQKARARARARASAPTPGAGGRAD